MNSDLQEFLTPKQQLFCNEYLVDMNATRAALRAGYSGATALNGQLMMMPKIQMYLQRQTKMRADRAQISHDMILRELGKIAFASMGNYFDGDGAVKPMHQLTSDEQAGLCNLNVRVSGDAVCTTQFKLYNKLAALDKIAKHTGFYNAKPEDAEPVYIYLNKADMTEDDSFDDARLKAEIKKEKAERKKEELRLKRQTEIRIKNKESGSGIGENRIEDMPVVVNDLQDVNDGVTPDDAGESILSQISHLSMIIDEPVENDDTFCLEDFGRRGRLKREREERGKLYF